MKEHWTVQHHSTTQTVISKGILQHQQQAMGNLLNCYVENMMHWRIQVSAWHMMLRMGRDSLDWSIGIVKCNSISLGLDHWWADKNEGVEKTCKKQPTWTNVCENIKQRFFYIEVLTSTDVFSLVIPEFIAGCCSQIADKERVKIKMDRKRKKGFVNAILRVKIARKKKGHENAYIFKKFDSNKCNAYLKYKQIKRDSAISKSLLVIWNICMEIMQQCTFNFLKMEAMEKIIVREVRIITVPWCHTAPRVVILLQHSCLNWAKERLVSMEAAMKESQR